MPSLPDAVTYLAAWGALPVPDAGWDFADRDAQWRAARESAVVTDASDLGLLAIDGADAQTFLHGQLSSDVSALPPARGHWTSYSSPKGRMLATLFLYRRPVSATAYAAVVAADVAPAVTRRLAMFVLRSKVSLADASASHRLLGVGGPRAADAIAAAFDASPAPGEAMSAGETEIVHWPDGRFVVVVATARAPATFDALARHATPAGPGVWSWLCVRSGVPMVSAATQDQFVPQTANWDAVGGLDFRKGCYPGQEIVARTQYLGRLKERLYAFRSAAPPPRPGDRLFGAAFGDQPSGTVVNAAPSPEGGSAFLAVVQTVVADAGEVTIGSPQGPRAAREPLPYAIPEPTAPRARA